MIDRQTSLRMWRLLDPSQRRAAARLAALMVATAVASGAMVASVFPFLSLLANPDWADGSEIVVRSRAVLGLAGDYAFVVAAGLLSIVIILTGAGLVVWRTYATARFSAFLVHDLSRTLFTRYIAQPYTFSLDRHSGDLATIVLSESEQVVRSFVRPALNIFASALTLVAVLVTVVSLQPVAGSIAFGSIGAIYLALLLATRNRVKHYGRRRAKANELRFRTASEAFGGIKDVKLIGLERPYVDRFTRPTREIADLSSRIAILSAVPRVLIQALVFSGIIVFSLALVRPETVGTAAAISGLLPTLGLIAFGAQRAMPEIANLFGSITQMRFGTAAVDRIWDDFAVTAGADALPESPPEPLRLQRTLQLDRVTFAYPDAERAGLDDVSLEIRAGERIGIVGATGAGKTTLADIVLGLLRPQSGRLRVDGTELTADKMRAWQRSVSYVPQDIFLTDASLAENIALGIPPDQIDRARVERSARLAHLHDFIAGELPHGYDTRTGERGVRLSGGQRQRVGIARALYHDADLIVLDEATSALDSLTEREVVQAIDGLPGETTVVMIAHRLSTLRGCDRLVLLDEGRVVAQGPWDRLLDDSPVFRAFARQAGMDRLEAVG